MEFVVKKGKRTTISVKPDELITSTLLDIVSREAGRELPMSSIISFDGKKVTFTDEEEHIVDIPDHELIKNSAENWIKKKFKLRGPVDISVNSKKGGSRKK